MQLPKIQSLLLMGLVLVSTMYASLEVVAALHEASTTDRTYRLWTFYFAIVIAYWTSNDAKERNTYRPYEYAYFIFLLWPLILPYHLIKTRGSEGLLLYIGVVAVYLLPALAGLATWAYFL